MVFSEGGLMIKYNESIYFGMVLYKQGVAGSIAFARSNAKACVITRRSLLSSLRERNGRLAHLTISPGVDENIFTAKERRLGEVISNMIAGKLHTGRSRNETVVRDMRMWLRDNLRQMKQHLINLLNVITARAEQEIDYVMPEYTHLQRAQPNR